MKKLILIPLVLFFLISCQDKEELANYEDLKLQAELTEQNKILINDFINAWNSRNTEKMIQMHTSGAKYHHPTIGSSPILYEDAIEQMKMLWEAFPDIEVDIKDLFAEENRAVIRFIGRGTHMKDFGGIPATEVMTEASAMEIFHIKDGKIEEVWEISDRLGLMQQLGMELQMKKNEK